MTVDIEESERQFIVLALAVLGLVRPGFAFFGGAISEKLHAVEMYESFRESNADVIEPAGPFVPRTGATSR